MLKKTIKAIAVVCSIVAGVLTLATVSQSDYEMEANIPIEERMSDKELFTKVGVSFILLGIGFGGMIYAHKDE